MVRLRTRSSGPEFAEDVVESEESESEGPSDQKATESGAVLEEPSTSEPSPDMSDREESQGPSKEDIPYIFRRNRVTDERTLHSYYLRDMVDVAEQECRHDVQQQLGEEVPKADLREAALLVAYRNPDLVATELREWGYDMD